MIPTIDIGRGADRRRPAAWVGWLLPVGFAALAGVIFTGSRHTDIPLPPQQAFDHGSLIVGPRRVAMTDPAHLLVEGRPQTCNGCHQIFNSERPAGTALDYHQSVRLNHGLNDRCVNCHDQGNRERLTLHDGSTVTMADTPRLCSQCHGTVYRDWQRGTHGKTLGSWITRSAAQQRLNCNQCHDPHSPKYEPYAPLPGPNTLRMGEQGHPAVADPGNKRSPLQRWLYELNAPQPGGRPHGEDRP